MANARPSVMIRGIERLKVPPVAVRYRRSAAERTRQDRYGAVTGQSLATGRWGRLWLMSQRHERRRTRLPRHFRRLAVLAASTLLLAISQLGLAQQELFDHMADLLDKGYYNSAARQNGLHLVDRLPDGPEAHFQYARALYLTGDLAGARTQLDVAMALAGEEVPAYSQLGALIVAAEGDPAGALRQLQNA